MSKAAPSHKSLKQKGIAAFMRAPERRMSTSPPPPRPPPPTMVSGNDNNSAVPSAALAEAPSAALAEAPPQLPSSSTETMPMQRSAVARREAASAAAARAEAVTAARFAKEAAERREHAARVEPPSLWIACRVDGRPIGNQCRKRFRSAHSPGRRSTTHQPARCVSTRIGGLCHHLFIPSSPVPVRR